MGKYRRRTRHLDAIGDLTVDVHATDGEGRTVPGLVETLQRRQLHPITRQSPGQSHVQERWCPSGLVLPAKGT